MLATDEDAVTCDFAETYHILDWQALDLPLAATLAAGLAPESRIKRKLRGERIAPELLLLASAVDHLAMIRWFLSEDGPKGINRPESIVALLTGDAAPEREANVITFGSGAAFDEARAQIIQGVHHGD